MNVIWEAGSSYLLVVFGVLVQWCGCFFKCLQSSRWMLALMVLATWSVDAGVLNWLCSFFRSNHNVISGIGSCQKMQRYGEGVLRERRRLLLHTWYKSAVLQVSFILCFSDVCLFIIPLEQLSKLFTLIQNSFSSQSASTCSRCDFNV